MWEGNDAPTLIALIYHPPDVSLWADRQFVKLLRSTISTFSHTIIMGDWNANILDLGSSDSRYVRKLIDELSLKLVNTGPSHKRANKYTWIDILLTDKYDTIVSYERKLPTFPSRHDIISVTIEIFRPELPAGS